jgi:hypothetical protein
MLTKGGGILVPMEVPNIWLKALLPNMNKLFCRISSIKWQKCLVLMMGGSSGGNFTVCISVAVEFYRVSVWLWKSATITLMG